ncbi:CbtB domain-containing protein [Ancylobacter lacus]|uniref:CbtB domain-containing protein n=1 Tax=Ancylobacter lacus TaxID=2579970 RepID=UPI001BCB314C|nr:CbtB-domain containing protein [Ancylobacter lacus]
MTKLPAPGHPATATHPGNPASLPLDAASPAARALAVSLAALLGVLVLGGVGFSHVEAVHNATHDVRHANAFPCH